MSSEYDNFVGGSLKLKSKDGVQEGKVKKKKKKSKKHKKDLERAVEEEREKNSDNEEEQKEEYVDTRTEAEKTFDRHREKKQAERLLEKASKSHKERIMDFNSHLDSLTEHFDIPKVSWTK